MKGGHTDVVKFLLSQGAKVGGYLGTYNSIANAIRRADTLTVY